MNFSVISFEEDSLLVICSFKGGDKVSSTSECRGGQATHSVIIHGLQKLWRGKFLQSRSDERDSMFGVSLVLNPAHKPRAFGEAWRRRTKIVSEGDSV